MTAPAIHFIDATRTDGPRWMRAVCPRCRWRSHRRLPVAPDTPVARLLGIFDALKLHFPPSGCCPRGCGPLDALIEDAHG